MERDKEIQDTITQIKSRLREYLEGQGKPIDNDFISCIHPNHPDRHPSCHIYDGYSGPMFHCFSCLTTGDIFTAAHLLEKLPATGVEFFTVTLKTLAERFGIEYEPIKLSDDQKRELQRRRAYSDSMSIVHMSAFRNGQLRAHHPAIRHLIERGINEESVRRFKIGCIDSFADYIKEMAELGWTDREYLNSAELTNKKIFSPTGIIIPIFDDRGRPVAFVTRKTSMVANAKGDEKYVNSLNSDIYTKGEVLFNFNNCNKEEGPLYIVEGYLDAVYLTQCGLKNVAAIGAVMLSEHHVALLHKYEFKDIRLCLDADEGGLKGTKHALENFTLYKGFNIKVVDLPENYDPDTYVRELGIDKFKELSSSDNALSPFAWTIKHTTFEDDPIKAANAAIPTISTEISSVKRLGMIKELARLTGVPEADIKKDVDHLVDRESSAYWDAVEEVNVFTQNQLARRKVKDTRAILNESIIKLKNVETKYNQSVDNASHFDGQLGEVLGKITSGKYKYGLRADGFKRFTDKIDGIPFSTCLTVVGGRPSAGKCNIKDTPIMMYNGTIKMVQDIVIGDILMGPDSKPRTVIALGSGEDNCYMVHQNGGMSYGVNSAHILTLKRSRKSKANKLVKKGDIIDINILDFINSSDKFKTNYKGFKVGVEFQPRKVFIDPYFLGLWLGDGTKSHVQITSQDKEIITYVHEYAKSINNYVHTQNKSNCSQLRVTSKVNKKAISYFNSYNLINNKHIPQDYISNSSDVRLKLLAGILDTNGHFVSGKNYYELTMKDEDLIDQTKYLCDTLGLRCIKHSKVASIKDINYSCTVYRLTISGDLTRIPCRVPRKMAKCDPVKRDWKTQGIEKIVPLGKQKYYGFQLLEDPHYLYSDGTVTHNTAWLTALELDLLKTNSDCAILDMSIDDTTELRVLKIISILSGLSISQIKAYPTLTDGQRKKVDAAYNWLRAQSNRFIIADTTAGNTVDALEGHVTWLCDKYPDYKKLIVLDNFHKIRFHGSRARKSEAIEEQSQRIKDIVQLNGVHLMMTVELRKLENTSARPNIQDLKDSVQMEYDSDIVLLVHNEYQAQEENTNVFWTGIDIEGNQRSMPYIEIGINKNKITGKLGKCAYQMNSSNMRLKEVPWSEVKGKYNVKTNEGYGKKKNI